VDSQCKHPDNLSTSCISAFNTPASFSVRARTNVRSGAAGHGNDRVKLNRCELDDQIPNRVDAYNNPIFGSRRKIGSVKITSTKVAYKRLGETVENVTADGEKAVVCVAGA
jgi:hypothetical protein